MAKLKNNNLPKDKKEHKVVSYFILRRLSKNFSLKTAEKMARFLMISKEVLDATGLGNPEKEDIKANEKGVEEAKDDIINKKPYRYKLGNKKFVEKILKYLHLND
jgi:hypothetical protein